MSKAEQSAVLERILGPAGRTMTPEVAHYFASLQADPEVEARLDDLSDRNAEGLLSDEERAEYCALVMMGDLLAILQLRARKLLREASPA